MPAKPHRLIALAALLAALSVVRHTTAQAPKPVAGVPFQYWDVLEADGGARKVYFRNDAATPITITQVVIQKCDNTRQNCGTYPANLVVPPGKTVVAFTAERYDRKLGWSFSYAFKTHGEIPASTQNSGIPPGAVIRGPDGSTSVLHLVSVDSLAPSVAAWTEGASCGNVIVPDLPAGHKALMMIFGTESQPAARRVLVRLDATGSAYDFSDTRRDPNESRSDPLQSQITLDLIRQTAMVRNSGAGQPASFYRATGPGLLTAASLSMPGETIAKIVKECSGGH